MKKVILAMVVMMAGSAYAADLNDLGVKASDLKAIAAADTAVVAPNEVKGSNDGSGEDLKWGGETRQIYRAFHELEDLAHKPTLLVRQRILDNLNYLNGVGAEPLRHTLRWMKHDGSLGRARAALNALTNKHGFPFIQDGARKLLRRVDHPWVFGPNH